MFYNAKEHLLESKRWSFKKQKGILFYKREQPYAVEKIKELKVKRI